MPHVRLLPSDIHILILDDAPSGRPVLKRLLQAAGVPTANITELAEAANLRDHPPSPKVDIIFLSLHLLGKSGYVVFHELRADPALSQAKVVLLSAYVTLADRERARAAGFDGFIALPIDIRPFEGFFQRLLEGETAWTE